MPNLTVNTRTVQLDIKADMKDKTPEERFNYIVEIQKLIRQILTDLGRISTSDHDSLEKMKHRYLNESLKNAGLQTEYGKVNRNISIAAFAIMSVRLFMPNVDDKEILNIISTQAPSLGGMYTAGIQSQMHASNAESQLELEKLRSKTADKQTEGNKQDYLSLLQSVAQNLVSASQGQR